MELAEYQPGMCPLMAVESFAELEAPYTPLVKLAEFDYRLGGIWDAVIQDCTGDELSEGGQSLAELERIDQLESELLRLYSGGTIKVLHSFPDGLYVREIIAPRDAIIVGHRHLHECLNVMTQGEVLTVVNGKIQRFVAPFMGTSGADTRKASVVVQDMRWATVHSNPDNERNIEVLEQRLVQKSPAFLKNNRIA